jgi:hypothetical protein
MRYTDKPTVSRLHVFAMVVLFLACRLAHAQPQIPSPGKTNQSQPVIRSNSRLVVLDVVVTDQAGHPITGLTKDDFRVLEDGKPKSSPILSLRMRISATF